jgi:hypothetical protein
LFSVATPVVAIELAEEGGNRFSREATLICSPAPAALRLDFYVDLKYQV